MKMVVEMREVTVMSDANILKGMVSQTDFSKGKAAAIIGRLPEEKRIVIMKNNKPSAVLLSPDEYMRLSEYEEDARLFAIAEERMKNAKSADFSSMGEVMNDFSITQDDLDKAGDVEIE